MLLAVEPVWTTEQKRKRQTDSRYDSTAKSSRWSRCLVVGGASVASKGDLKCYVKWKLKSIVVKISNTSKQDQTKTTSNNCQVARKRI